MGVLEIFLATLVFTIVIMTLTWLFAVKIENFSIIDAVWSFCFLIHTLIFFFLEDGFLPRKILFLCMVGFWSFRLGAFLSKRISGHHPQEDSRYIQLRKEYGSNYKKKFFIFFTYQAISVSFLTLPFIFIFKNRTPEILWVEWLGLAVWTLSVVGEAVADHQKITFRSNPANAKKVCDVGLWHYSRHPNYFFESCIWWGYFLVMLGSGIYWGVYTALTMLFLLVKVTGVPLSEVQSLKARGDEFRRYQKRTSVFIPWFPKKG